MNSVINQYGTIPTGYVVPIFTITLFLFSLPVYAGMPRPEIIITTAASFPTMGVSAISFFVFIILMAALFTKLLWNYLRQDFPSLPFITYKKSLALVLLLGLLLNVVLFMIAGARELMTPGAWKLAEPNSVTYQLTFEGVEKLLEEPDEYEFDEESSNPSEISQLNGLMNPEAPWEPTGNFTYRLNRQPNQPQSVSE